MSPATPRRRKTPIKFIQEKIYTFQRLAFTKKYLPFTFAGIFVLMLLYAVMFVDILKSQFEFNKPKAELAIVQQPSKGEALTHLALVLNTTKVQGKKIDGIQLVGKVEGLPPEAIQFSSAPIEGLQPLFTSVTNENGQASVKVVLLTQPPNPYTIQDSLIYLGELVIDDQQVSQQFSVSFDARLAKINETQTIQNLLAIPRRFTFTPQK